MIPVIETDAKIKIPGGYLVCIKTGAADDYPGFGVFYSKDGETGSHWIPAPVRHLLRIRYVRSSLFC